MATLKVAVSGLDNLDELVPVLQQLAKRHVAYGVTADDYTPVGNALLYTLKPVLAMISMTQHGKHGLKLIKRLLKSCALQRIQTLIVQATKIRRFIINNWLKVGK